MLLDISLLGSSHDSVSWPTATISLNNEILWDGAVVNETSIQKEMSLRDENILEITHYGKKFGENRQWHTRIDGDTVFDRNIIVKQIRIGSVDIKDLLHLGHIHNSFNQRQLDDFAAQNIEPPLLKELVHQEKIFMGYNSTYKLAFPLDFYDWVIVHKTPYSRPYDPQKQSALNSVNWRLDWSNSDSVKRLISDIEASLDML